MPFGFPRKSIVSEAGPRKDFSWRRIALFCLKIGITLYILWRIGSRMDLAQAFRSILSMPLYLAGLIFFTTCIRHFLQYQNWYCALHLNPNYIPNKKEITVSYLVALPLRFLLPGGHASFGKVFYVKNDSLKASIYASVAERSFMSWATWSFAALATIFYYPATNLILRVSAFIFALCLPLLAGFIIRLIKNDEHILTAYKQQAPRMMLLQIAASSLVYLQYWLILNHLHVISFVQSWLRIALTNFSNTIPITIAGLGLREGFAMHFLSGAGFSAEQAVTATLYLFFFQDIIPALVGAAVLIRAKRCS